MTEPTLDELIEMKNPGKYLAKYIKKNQSKYLSLTKHIEVFESKSIDPISWIYLTIIKDNPKYNYIPYYFNYVRARGGESSKNLWKLVKAFRKDSNKWKKILREEYPNTYESNIFTFTAIATVVNPDKFSYISKYLMAYIGNMDIERYIRNIERGAFAKYNGDTVEHSFNV